MTGELASHAAEHVDPAVEEALDSARSAALRARSTLDLIDPAVVVHQADGRVAEVNLGAHRMFGPGASDLVGQAQLPPWWRPTLADGTPLVDGSHPAARVLAERLPVAEAVLSLQVPGGPTRWFVARARPLAAAGIGGGGRGDGAVTTYVEITEQRSRLAEAQREEDEANAAFGELPFPSYVVDAALVPERTNRAWSELIGAGGSGGARRRAADLLAVAHPADRAALGATLHRALAEGRPAQLFHRLAPGGGPTRWVQHRVTRRHAGSEAGDGRDGDGTEPAGLCGTLVPVPEHVALADRTQRLVDLVETAHDLVLDYDVVARRVTYLNRRSAELFVPPGGEAADLDIAAVYPPEAQELFRAEAWPALCARGRWEGELPMVTFDGRRRQVQQWMTTRTDDEGRVVRLTSLGHDVTDRSQREAELSLRANHDALTGLPNRARLLDHLDLALRRARRTGQLVALIYLDLDRFKSVNDRLGHEAGDQLLRQAARRLAGAVREGDTLARLGGDEFAALCDGVDDTAQALQIADAMFAAVGDERYELDGGHLRATASVGVALSKGVDHPEALLRDADAAMYRAKDLGRARLEVVDDTTRSRATDRGHLSEELRSAVTSGAITVHYQPSIDLRSGEVRSVESLARWQHPHRGLLPPGEFIGVADSTGLVAELGLEVLRQACHKVRAWQSRWGSAAPRMHVNLSGRQVADPELARLVAEVLAETGADPALVCLELTESILLEDAEAAIVAITALKDLGVSLAIDDFGTGYSSLSYLARLPVDVVKVDKSFVDGLDPVEGDTRVVAAAIMSLAQTLGLSTIAEGVTTVSQLGELHRLGCDAAQGYYFSPPLDGEAIEAYLARTLTAGDPPDSPDG